jgi:3',5'-cyclic AMP phosphodiesterase CpdA
LVDQVRAGLNDLAQGRQVDDARLADYQAATKVLILHYAANRRAVSGAPGRDELALPHSCRGIKTPFDATSGQIDLVLHGHLHQAKIYRHRGVPVISVPTLCQQGEQERGFFTLEAADAGVRRTLHARYHRWDRFSFVHDPSQTIALQCRTRSTAVAS